jgi:hypothetical protein
MKKYECWLCEDGGDITPSKNTIGWFRCGKCSCEYSKIVMESSIERGRQQVEELVPLQVLSKFSNGGGECR